MNTAPLKRWLCTVSLGLATACASPVGRTRFDNQPITTLVNDRRSIPEPRNRPFVPHLHQLDSVSATIDKPLAAKGKTRALDINALGRVPDSTWFTNRIGVRDISPEQILTGHGDDAGPMAAKPWKVVSTKVGGRSPGVQFIDANGVRYLLKFDQKGAPELDTGADVVVQRLVWALGYNTPVDEIVYFERSDLVLADDAAVKDLYGNKRPMLVDDLEEILNARNAPENGRYRGITSRFLPGVPIGGYARTGLRSDDPNDTIPHEHRRSIRAQQVLFGWLGHTDVKVDNTLDMWVEDGDAHYVRHYAVDFGNGLGVWAKGSDLPWSGFKHSVDLRYGLASMLALGFWTRPWEKVPDDVPEIRGVGWVETEHFDPGGFQTNQHYHAFAQMDPYDALWAAELLTHIEPKHIRAAVQAAQYTAPEAEDYLTRTLVARQRKAEQYWFERVNPVDNFELDADRFCFDDLLVKRGFDDGASTRYTLALYNRQGRDTGWASTPSSDHNGRICVDGVTPSRSQEGYTILGITTLRADERLEPAFVHMAVDPSTSELRVIGVWRR